MTDSSERLAYLEAENARLQRIAEAAGIPALVIDLPNLRELTELRSMVLRQYPVELTCPLDQFERAIRYLCYARRQPKPNTQFYPVFWLDACRDWSRKQGYDTNISLRALVAGCVASGVAYTPLNRWPFDVELGLARGDVSKPSNAWRAVLEAGRLPEPTPLRRQILDTEPINMIQPHDPVVDARGSAGARVERS